MKNFTLFILLFASGFSTHAQSNQISTFEIECEFQRSRQIEDSYINLRTKKVFTRNDLDSNGQINYITGRDLSWTRTLSNRSRRVQIPYLNGNRIVIPVLLTQDGVKFSLNLNFNIETKIISSSSSVRPFEIGQEVKLMLGNLDRSNDNRSTLDYFHATCKRTK